MLRVCEDTVYAGLSDARLAKLQWIIDSILSKDEICEAESKSLPGKLQWVQCTMMGRCGRAKAIAIQRRAERKGAFRNMMLN